MVLDHARITERERERKKGGKWTRYISRLMIIIITRAGYRVTGRPQRGLMAGARPQHVSPSTLVHPRTVLLLERREERERISHDPSLWRGSLPAKGAKKKHTVRSRESFHLFLSLSVNWHSCRHARTHQRV